MSKTLRRHGESAYYDALTTDEINSFIELEFDRRYMEQLAREEIMWERRHVPTHSVP